MKSKYLALLPVCALLITACGASPTAEPTPDVAAVRTSAASTVISQFTLTAAVFTPTTAPPSETATPEPPTATATQDAAIVATNEQGTPLTLCDILEFVSDETVPDGSILTPGQDFLKTWRVKNTGSCPWGAGYKLVYAGYSDDMSGQWQPLTEVIQPGQEVSITVQFQAPDSAGEYVSAWQMQNPAGFTFPAAVFVKIIVQP